jgi:hypothetical protein
MRKNKVVPVQATNIYWRSVIIVPLIFDLDTRWEWPTSRPGHLLPEKEPWHALNTRFDGPLSRSKRVGGE